MPNEAEVRSPVEIMEDVFRDVGKMIRTEIRLARAEVVEEARKVGKASGFFAGAAVTGFLAAACLTTTIVALFDLVMPLWLAALLTGGILTCVAGAFYAGGRSKLRTVQPVPERTVETMKDNLQWAKQRMT